MTTFSQVVANTRLHLMTSHLERVNVLDSGINNSVTSLNLDFDSPQIIEGAVLGINFEEMYVVSKTGTAVTVIRGWNGSTPASHNTGDVIRVNAKFTDYRLSKYVNEALEDLSGDGLFWISQVEFNYNPARVNYDLNAANLIDVWRVKFDIPGPSKLWPELNNGDFLVDLDANTTDFPSGKSILLQRGGYPGRKVRVSYKASFTALASPADDVAVVSHLHQEAHKLLGVGAAIIALGGREVKRTFLEHQPEPRRQEEVPVGGASQAMNPLLRIYVNDLKRERRRLRRKYPDKVF